MRQDRFLTAILIGIAAVIILAVAVFFIRRGEETYVADDNPAGVVQNYALAVTRKDYQRAYTYLAEGPGKPDMIAFEQTFLNQRNETEAVSLQIGETSQTIDRAMVNVTVLRSSGPFESIYRTVESATLKQENGQWKLIQMPYPYWGWDWYQVLDQK